MKGNLFRTGPAKLRADGSPAGHRTGGNNPVGKKPPKSKRMLKAQ